MSKKNRKEKKVHTNKYSNVELGQKEISKYRSLLEEICCINIPLNGFPKPHEMDKGKIPTRREYDSVKEIYRKRILEKRNY
jgi:hypothetical protein